ncbi:hypothetical protein HW115_13700 [Verrucomicrobiaceae bacterium N1E253]|uniref:Uncharacterized protein n=1 Tax=Oceaniferula marina TaxID=2748318 RepID=A0A851GIB9_9BACT|nr:hypothetical protein [Oceaniferula marina]NWK56672.1 hypothetical protein [Oceaniferula marina]
MHRSQYIGLLIGLCCFSSCGKKESADAEQDQGPKPVLKAEDQADDRNRRRERLSRDRELYLARLQKSAREYSKEQSKPVVEENLQTFRIRYDGYVNEIYTPELKKLGLKPNTAPSVILPLRNGAKVMAVNFYTGNEYQIPSNRSAGLDAVTQTHWNNVSHQNQRAEHGKVLDGQVKGLQLADGSRAGSVTLTWQAPRLTNRRNSPKPDTDGSLLLMSSNLEGKELSFSLQGLNASGFKRYDLVLYMEYVLDENQQDGSQQPISRVDVWGDSDRTKLLASDLVSGVKVSGNPYEGQIRSFTRQDSKDRTFLCSNTGKPGHYVYFADLTASDLYFHLGPPEFGKVSDIRLGGLQVIER